MAMVIAMFEWFHYNGMDLFWWLLFKFISRFVVYAVLVTDMKQAIDSRNDWFPLTLDSDESDGHKVVIDAMIKGLMVVMWYQSRYVVGVVEYGDR